VSKFCLWNDADRAGPKPSEENMSQCSLRNKLYLDIVNITVDLREAGCEMRALKRQMVSCGESENT
jgi:hypothetical protein